MTKRRAEFHLEIAGHKTALGARTLIMGVLNVTPDSFSDGGRYLDPARAIQQGVDLVHQGADWIDVGGESTRPGAESVSVDEELRRVLPVIRALRRKLPRAPISIDTTKAEVAEQALDAGASILNDVSGLRFDPRLAKIAARYKVPLILMHMRGTPVTMQRAPFVRDVWRAVLSGLQTSIGGALDAGVRRSQLIVDPGLGFGKTRRQNFEIVAGLEKLQRLGFPILIGASRKSFVRAIVAGEGLEPSRTPKRPRALELAAGSIAGKSALKIEAERPLALLAGDAAMVVAAILGGAHLVRVHEPAAILPAVRIADALLAVRE